MSRYLRDRTPGGTYFFTVVSRWRRPLFSDRMRCALLGQIMREVHRQWPFRTVGCVLLPDHLHCVWTLPEGDADYSRRWRLIKARFSRVAAETGLVPGPRRRGAGARIWQPRFWEHRIRDEVDLEHHLDYLHFNPVKHGWCRRPGDWPWSTFRRHVAAGRYPANWAASPADILEMGGEPPATKSARRPGIARR